MIIQCTLSETPQNIRFSVIISSCHNFPQIITTYYFTGYLVLQEEAYQLYIYSYNFTVYLVLHEEACQLYFYLWGQRIIKVIIKAPLKIIAGQVSITRAVSFPVGY